MKRQEIVSNSPEKMDLRSMDVGVDNRERLKALLPSIFAETQNEKGELLESIDFEKLKAELGSFSDLFEARRERYGMDWPGKKDCMKLIQQPSVATLNPCREESVRFDDTENLFIEGDNLEVLKLLQKSYYGRVKMIYIDPPYNTGKEFIYPDNYSETLDTYLAYAGLADDEGRKFSTNTPNEGRFHTKWLNMMYPRLYLARNLLREDGVIFISIDDNEVSNLRKLCDEIFGEENFIAQNVWQKRYSRENRGIIGDAHEYVVVYARGFQNFKEVRNLISITESQKRAYRKTNGDPRGPWRAIPMTAQGYRPNQMYEIVSPSGKVFLPPEGRCWGMVESEFLKLKKEGRIYFGKSDDAQPGVIRYLDEVKGVVPWTWWAHEEVGHTDEAKKEIREFLGQASVFDNPKPVRLIKRALEIAADSNEIVLDFFSGSCTTAHALLNLNKKEGGNRKFIMVQLPEPCDEKSEAFKAGYNTIADIGKERIRRVIRKIEEERAAKTRKAEGMLPGMAEELPDLDLGFKVLKLDRSNFKIWDGNHPDASEEKIGRQLELHIDHIDPEASQEDILFELLLKAGFMPTEKVEKRELAGKTVFSMAGGTLLVCLENEITPELIDAVAEAEPSQFICLDRGFQGNDQLKANAVQTFAARNQRRDKAEQILFRTV